MWYEDQRIANGGDGTVPLASSRDQFVGDSRVTLMPFTGDHTAHTELPSNVSVQRAILDTLGLGY